jgi:hypothetical protein
MPKEVYRKYRKICTSIFRVEDCAKKVTRKIVYYVQRLYIYKGKGFPVTGGGES